MHTGGNKSGGDRHTGEGQGKNDEQVLSKRWPLDLQRRLKNQGRQQDREDALGGQKNMGDYRRAGEQDFGSHQAYAVRQPHPPRDHRND